MLDTIKKKLFPKKYADPIDDTQLEQDEGYESGGVSYDDYDPADEAKTVKKPLILAGAGAVALAGVMAVASNALFSGDPPEQQDTQQGTSSVGTSARTPADAFPARYTEIGQKDHDHSHTHGTDVRDVDPNQNMNPNMNPNVAAPVYVPTTPPGGSSGGTQTGANGDSAAYERAEKAAEEAAKRRALIDGSALAFQIAKAMADNAPPQTQPLGNAPAPGANTAARNISYAPQVQDALGGHILSAGSVIQATLLTGVTSNVPNGDVVAQVRQNIYDSLTGRFLLIPQGSRLIGKTAEAGGKRIGVIFQRIILPSGASLELPDQQAIDGVGYPGLSDKYDDHRGSIYRAGFMSALLGAGLQSLTGHTSGTAERSPGQEAVSGAVASILQTMQQLISKDINAEATIDISPGYQFSVFINQDLSIGAYSDE